MINFFVFFINFALFTNPSVSFAQSKPLNKKLGGFEIRVLKRTKAHINTAALLCALLENNSSQKIIDAAWKSKLKQPVNSDDEYIVRFIMRDMCPSASEYYFKN